MRHIVGRRALFAALAVVLAVMAAGATAFALAPAVAGAVWHQLPWLDRVRDALGSPGGLFYLSGFLMLLVAAHQLLWRDRGRGHRRAGGGSDGGPVPSDRANGTAGYDACNATRDGADNRSGDHSLPALGEFRSSAGRGA